MGNKYKSLAKNTAIFAVGSFGSKVLSFLIVPMYTYVLTTDEYGKIDLFTTAISLMIPFVTLLFQEAILRFVMGDEVDDQTALSNGFLIFLGSVILTVLLWPCFYYLFDFGQYTYIFTLILILNSFTQIFSVYLRASGANIAFTVNGIILTGVMLFSNVFFLVYLHLGMKGYFYSQALAQFASALHILVVGKIVSKISLKKVSFLRLKEMLKFCIPLIPNSLMWWIMSAGDKYIINYYMGDSANGLYSLAMKVPTVISMVYTIFYQAWQMSAIQENSKEDTAKFYENVYVGTNVLLSLIIACVIIIIKPLYLFAMSASFTSAWSYVPLLSIATFFNCSAGFFGVVYTVSKKSYKAFYTTLVGAVTNLLFNFILIPRLGMYGVAIGTSLGYLIVMLIRMYDAKKEVGMKFDVNRTLIMVLCIISQAVVTTLDIGFVTWIFGIIVIIIIFVLYKRDILSLIKPITKRRK